MWIYVYVLSEKIARKGLMNVITQQAIISTKVDHDLWRHMASLGDNELIAILYRWVCAKKM